MTEGKEILAGFNAGYIIEKHQPELFKQLENAIEKVELPFFESFIEGGKEYSKERAKTKFLNELKKDFTQPPSYKDYSKEDIDIDPEI